MPGVKLRLGRPDVAAVIDETHAAERDGWRKTRLLAIKLAARGKHTSAEVADICGIARGHLFRWLAAVREGGLEALLKREKPGPRDGAPPRGVDEAVFQELLSKLRAGDFITAQQARQWLEETHGVIRPYETVWRWLKKAGGVLLVPRPSHSKKDPAAAEEFRETLTEKLESLDIAEGSKVKIWMMDEARFGLHTEMRRLWACKGQRPVVTRQIKYEWDYLYGSLDVIGGRAHFCQIPAVNQEWDRRYLEDLAMSDEEVIHILIRDQAGFHLRDGDPRLPDRIRIIDLPPYCPELNPCEQLWDLVKDGIGNKVHDSIEALRQATLPVLERYWNDAAAVLRLVGRDWLLDQVNATEKNQVSY